MRRAVLHPATAAVVLLAGAAVGAWLPALFLLAAVAGAAAGFANSGST